MTVKQIVCFIMSTVGLILLTGASGNDNGKNHIGVLFGLGAAVFYATAVFINKFLKNVDGIHRTFLQFFSAAIVLFPYIMITDGITIHKSSSLSIVNLLIVGVVHTGITYCMYFSSLKELPGQKVAVLSYIDPLVAVIISVTLLGEPMNFKQIIGGFLILGFTLVDTIKINFKD